MSSIWLVQRTEKHERPLTIGATHDVVIAEKCAAELEACRLLYIYTKGKDNSLPERFASLLDGHYAFYEGVVFKIKPVPNVDDC